MEERSVMDINKNTHSAQFKVKDEEERRRERSKSTRLRKKRKSAVKLEEEEFPPEEAEDHQKSSMVEIDYRMELSTSPLLCRCLRVGSYSVRGKENSQVRVYMGMDGISFKAPMVSNANKRVNVIIKPSDITQMLTHFGKCLPILFIYTTVEFAEAVRKSLDISTPDFPYYDPSSNDEKKNKIIFLIDAVTEDQRNFLRHQFLDKTKIKEIDQKSTNEILVKSAPEKKRNKEEPQNLGAMDANKNTQSAQYKVKDEDEEERRKERRKSRRTNTE